MGRSSKGRRSTQRLDEDETVDIDQATRILSALSVVSTPKGDELERLRNYYTLWDKAEWWWVMDDSVAEIGRRLQQKNFVILDGFVLEEQGKAMRRDVRHRYEDGSMQPGQLAGGKTGGGLKYSMQAVRGDHVGWFSGEEKHEWEYLPRFLQKIDTLVSELGPHVKELARIGTRSHAMLACYPGGGAHYVKHSDNPNQNGRRLTVLCYFNYEWKEGDGGELRVYAEDNQTILQDVKPLGGRLLLFWSNNRVPHEVLPSSTMRYTATTWFYDEVERSVARTAGTPSTENQRILKEIEKFKEIYGEEEQVTMSDEPAATTLHSEDSDDNESIENGSTIDESNESEGEEIQPPASVLSGLIQEYSLEETDETLAVVIPVPAGTTPRNLDLQVSAQDISIRFFSEEPQLVPLPAPIDPDTVVAKMKKSSGRMTVTMKKV